MWRILHTSISSSLTTENRRGDRAAAPGTQIGDDELVGEPERANLGTAADSLDGVDEVAGRPLAALFAVVLGCIVEAGRGELAESGELGHVCSDSGADVGTKGPNLRVICGRPPATTRPLE